MTPRQKIISYVGNQVEQNNFKAYCQQLGTRYTLGDGTPIHYKTVEPGSEELMLMVDDWAYHNQETAVSSYWREATDEQRERVYKAVGEFGRVNAGRAAQLAFTGA